MRRGTHRSRAGGSRIRPAVVGVGVPLLIFAVIAVAIGAFGLHARSSAVGTDRLAQSRASAIASAPAEAPATAAAASAASPSPAAAAAGVDKRTTPERMARLLRGSRQMIVITGAKIGSRAGTLEVFNESGGTWLSVMSAPANFGANGLVDGVGRTAGHLQTPTGIWRLGDFLFGQHPAPPPGTTMSYRQVTQDTWWSAAADSTYNTWVTSQSAVSGEHLADAKVQYEYAFNTGYNSPPNQVVIGRGTAIFIHCSEPPDNSLGDYTHGCIAIDPRAIKHLFMTLDPTRHPTCAIGTLEKGSSTSIWAY